MTSKYITRAQNLIKIYRGQTNFQRVAANCRVIDAEEGRLKVEFDVEHEHSNPVNTLHGGYTATLVDILTTSALLLTDQPHGGVSVDLHVSYMSTAKIGETVIIDSQVIKQGRSMAFTRADIYRKSDNRLVATALHTKAITPFSIEVSKSHL